METFFTIGQVPPEAFVYFMLIKIVARHLNEIKQYQSLDYLAFREKLVEVFEEPDLSTVYLNALASLSQTRDKSIFDYMHRARLLVLKAHPDLAHASRKRILITFPPRALRPSTRLIPRCRENPDSRGRRTAGC